MPIRDIPTEQGRERMIARKGTIEHPAMEQYSDTPIYNTKAVVQQTGVAAPTLRAWERRYKLLSPERADNTYRLYSQRDIMLIRWLKARTDEGMAISKAVSLFQQLSAEHQQNTRSDTNKEQPISTISSPEIFQVALPAAEQGEREATARFDWSDNSNDYMQKAYPALHNMQMVRERLLEAFSLLDESVAQTLIASMLAIYSVEKVCTELITPTLWQIGQRWAEGKVTITVEHFASNFFRGLLTNLFHISLDSHSSPLVLVASAPGEPHELATLMLALFLRRRGLRVAYLGQSIETGDLLHTIKQLTPSMVCLSLTMPAYLSELVNLGKHIADIPSPRPIFAFGGQAFSRYPNVIEQVPGIYLNGDLLTTVEQLKNMIMKHP